MKYFIIVLGSTRPQNKLQERVEFLAQRWNRVLTDTPVEVEGDLKAVLADAAHRFPKCRPLTMRQRSQTFVEGVEVYNYWLGLPMSDHILVTVTLLRVEPQPLPMVRGGKDDDSANDLAVER